jgi:hypothetical protein
VNVVLSTLFICATHFRVPKGRNIMKIIVRSLVIALAVTGAIATSYANAASSKTTVTAPVNIHKTSAMPIPGCPPSDPGSC